MGSAPMVEQRRAPRKRRHAWGASAAALVVAAGVTTLPTTPSPGRQYDHRGGPALLRVLPPGSGQGKRYTGKGVTIAMIDGPVETTAAELTGASIQERETCTINSSLASKSHGTSVASVLVSGSYGVAPEATLLTYRTGSKQDGDQPSSIARITVSI